MKTRAALLREANKEYSIETIHLPELTNGEILVRIVGAGMCHTDMLPRASGNDLGSPIVVGHEGSGIVEATAPNVVSVKAGAHVVLSFDYCGSCRSCRLQLPSYCREFMTRNLTGHRTNGERPAMTCDGTPVRTRWFGQSSFAEYAIATERNVVQVNPSLPLAYLGPLGCGIQTGAGAVLNALKIGPGSTFVVYGAGAVGLSAVMAARVAGAEKIIAVDLHTSRLVKAEELGATHTLEAGSEGLSSAITEITDGGADYSLDTTGVPEVIYDAITALRLGGKCAMVGVQLGPVTLDANILTGKSILNILEGDSDPQTFIPQLIQLWEDGRFPFDELIETFEFERINEAERASMSGDVVKPLLLL